MLEIHWREWAPFREFYGDDVLLDQVNKLPELHVFWLKKIEEQKATQSKRQIFSFSDDRLDLDIRPNYDHPSSFHTLSSKGQYFERDTEVSQRQKQMEEEKRLREAEEVQLKRKREDEGKKVQVTHRPRSRIPQLEDCATGKPSHEEHKAHNRHRPPTYMRVEKKYLSEDTLNLYRLPWEIDQVCHDKFFPIHPLLPKLSVK